MRGSLPFGVFVLMGVIGFHFLAYRVKRSRDRARRPARRAVSDDGARFTNEPLSPE